MTDFLQHPGYRLLLSLNLPHEDFAIAGSGPLFARGWITDPEDVDVVARRSAWEVSRQLGTVSDAPFSQVARVLLFEGQIEVLDGWFPELWDVNELIDQADVIRGLRFVKMEVVAESKRLLQRPRDKLHLQVISEHGGDP
jgi:hypothetical protein